MSQAILDMDVHQESKFIDIVYTHKLSGYITVAKYAPSHHLGVVVVFYCASPRFSAEALQQFGPNVISFQIVMGYRIWYIVICYLVPNNASVIENVIASLGECPHGSKLLMAGNFNANLTGLEEVE